jgi:hypothetical protein
MAKVTSCVSALILAVFLTVTNAGKVRAASDGSSVALLALPSPQTGRTTPETRRQVQAIGDRLRAEGFRIVVAGTKDFTPAEELTAVANASAVDLVLGFRSLDTARRCAAVIAPPPVLRPAQSGSSATQAELAALVRRMMAFARFEASASLADSLASEGEWCHPTPTGVARYVLEASIAPTVLVGLPSRDQGRFMDRLPAVVRGWQAAERRRK